VAIEPYIDAHSHIWTPDVAHYPLARGFAVADMKPPSFTAEELLAHRRPAAVGRVNLIQMSFYEFDNRYMLDMIKQYPERFVGTAIVDPLGDDPGAEMEKLHRGGVRAFRIQPHYSKQPPGR
jgi:predicted TIM-barrel fold metal-dependent hydrolase